MKQAKIKKIIKDVFFIAEVEGKSDSWIKAELLIRLEEEIKQVKKKLEELEYRIETLEGDEDD